MVNGKAEAVNKTRVSHCLPYLAVRDLERISTLTKRITEVHNQTTWFSVEHVRQYLKRKTIDSEQVAYYGHYHRNVTREECWLNASQKMTITLHQIVSFAQMVPGFVSLTSNDRMTLLKRGCYQLAMLRASPYIDVSRNCLLYGDALLPLDVFRLYGGSSQETNFVISTFETLKRIADLGLTDLQLALYSALVLLSPPEQSGLEEVAKIGRLREGVESALRTELEKTSSKPVEGGISVNDDLVIQVATLGKLSSQHLTALKTIRESAPHIQFPNLYTQLFLEE